MGWTVKEFKEALKEVPDEAVLHLQINSHMIEQATTIVLMERAELYPALVLSPFVRQADAYEMIDGKIIDKHSKK
ncbi:hypothetical protein [Enterococcus alishanensis]